MSKLIKMYVHYAKDGLPDAWAYTAGELAKMLGVSKNAVLCGCSNHRAGYAKVVFYDDDEFLDMDYVA